MPPKPRDNRYREIWRDHQGHMPGHLVVSTLIYAAFAYVAWNHVPDSGATKYVLYFVVVLPLAAPAVAVFLQYASVLSRRIAALIIVRRARLTFRSALRAARIHPELVDLDKLRAAAAALSSLAPADALRASAEIAAAAEHPYAPIRRAGRDVIDAARLISRHAGTGSAEVDSTDGRAG